MYKLLKTFDENCFKDGVYTVPEGITDIDMTFLLGKEDRVKKIVFPKTLKYIEGIVNLTNVDEFEFNSDFHIGPDVFRMTENIRRISVNETVLEASENEKLGFYENGFAKVTSDGRPTVYDKNGQEIVIDHVDDNLYKINPDPFFKEIFIPKTAKNIEYIDFSNAGIYTINFEDISSGITIGSKILFQDGIFNVNEGEKSIASFRNEVNYLFSVNGELAFYDTDYQTGERKICIVDSNSKEAKNVTDTLELKEDRTTRLIDIAGVSKLIADIPELIGFLTDEKLTELEIKTPISQKQKRYTKLLDEIETLNYDFSSGWKNLRKIKLGDREFEVPEDEQFANMSDIAFLTEEGDIAEDLIISTQNEQGIYTYVYNDETKEFEKYDAKEFIAMELETTEEAIDNILEILRYAKSKNTSVFLEHYYRTLSMERLKKYIDIVEPGLCDETIDNYRTPDTDVIDLTDIENTNVNDLMNDREMNQQKEEALRALGLTEKDYRYLVLDMKRCKIMNKSVEPEFSNEEDSEYVIKLKEYIEYEHPELIVDESEKIGTEKIAFDIPITPEMLDEKMKASSTELEQNIALSESSPRSTIGEKHRLKVYGNAVEEYEDELRNTPFFRVNRRKELENDIKFLKSEIEYYTKRNNSKSEQNAKIAFAKANKDKLERSLGELSELSIEIQDETAIDRTSELDEDIFMGLFETDEQEEEVVFSDRKEDDDYIQ